MKRINNKLAITLGTCALLTMSCTKLDETLYGSRYVEAGGGGATTAQLSSVYDQVNSFNDQAGLYALLEHPTDEMMGPTRGTDWDDYGIWRKLHLHTWDATHEYVFTAWNGLNIGVFRATQVISNATDNQIKAEASFLRAFFMFFIVDLYGQAPFREVSDSPDTNPRVLTRKEATDLIIQDLQFAEANLASGAPGKATKEAAKFLLAKVSLNKAVFYQDPASPAGPFTFVKADMDQVITYCNDVINTGKYQIDDSYFDNFKWDNTTASSEIIFSRINEFGTSQISNVENRDRMGLHYNTTPDGWNGFTTLADFYSSFETTDQRRGTNIAGYTDVIGSPAGFLAGQQFKIVNGQRVQVQDRSGNPLIFTPEVNINYATEAQGIRVVKYPLNPANFSQSGNDLVWFRYADLMLMKAEAILRGGTDPMGQTALAIVNELRTKRGASTLGTLDEAMLLAERGREMYYEGWRRNDQIRFGTFNAPVNERPNPSDPTRVIFPIPQRAIDTNPNLTQNPGY
jgi:hypothetical protein